MRPVINPMTIGMFWGAIWVPFWIQLSPFGIPLGHLWGLISLTFRGVRFFIKKGGPGTTRTSNTTSFWEPFWVIFSYFFITFLETSKTGFGTTLQYFRRFLLSKGSHFWVQFRFRFRSVFGPLKKAPRGRSCNQPLATPGQLFGPAGGGFRRGVC